MKLSLDLRTSLSQTLTPQQIQYLKLLQLPVLQMEQQVMQEIEQNPMLELSEDYEDGDSEVSTIPVSDEIIDYSKNIPLEHLEKEVPSFEEEYNDEKEFLKEQEDPFDMYNLVWQDDSDFARKNNNNDAGDDDFEPYQVKEVRSFVEELTEQIQLLPLTEEETILAEQIIGNIDSDGYLRRELNEILEETNSLIEDINYEDYIQQNKNNNINTDFIDNPARKYALSSESESILKRVSEIKIDVHSIMSGVSNKHSLIEENFYGEDALKKLTLEHAEKILLLIQRLDPPGIGSRNVQECLIAQARASRSNAAQKLALEILTNCYDSFAKKHYQAIIKQYNLTDEYLREAIDFIRRLNPKPGGGDLQGGLNSVIPDFVVNRDEETDELIINVNDSHIPALKLNKTYERIKKEAKHKSFNKETREWIRGKYEDAKFMIQAIRQRKITMLKVMTAIAYLQKQFFYFGPAALKPLIYKDISENTGLDISTVCRIVNGKYVQTEFGTFELKFYFSESLPNDEGEEVSTTVIKQIIKDIIDKEDKSKPYSDDKITSELKKSGYNVARMTIAKYREQLKLPVARLRKEL